MELWEFLLENGVTLVWLVLIILLLLIEIATVGLTSIWAAGGALVAMLLSILHIPTGWQITAFLLVTAVLIYFTRPFAKRMINSKCEKTNYEGIIGKTIRIEERVDNIAQTGMAIINGQEWTVRSQEENEILEPGTLAKIVNISGVKLIVKKYKED